MTLKSIIKQASELAYEEDANQVVGKIYASGEWAIANTEDAGRIAAMDGRTTFKVTSQGADAGDFMEAMEAMGIDGDQDWEHETTRYEVGGEIVVVCGQDVDIPTRWESVASIALDEPFADERGYIRIGETDRGWEISVLRPDNETESDGATFANRQEALDYIDIMWGRDGAGVWDLQWHN